VVVADDDAGDPRRAAAAVLEPDLDRRADGVDLDEAAAQRRFAAQDLASAVPYFSR
jgi:hypothetical protein